MFGPSPRQLSSRLRIANQWFNIYMPDKLNCQQTNSSRPNSWDFPWQNILLILRHIFLQGAKRKAPFNFSLHPVRVGREYRLKSNCVPPPHDIYNLTYIDCALLQQALRRIILLQFSCMPFVFPTYFVSVVDSDKHARLQGKTH